MYYVLSMRGCKPKYYNANEYHIALKKYLYMKEYFSGVSLSKANRNKVIKDVIVTQRTI